MFADRFAREMNVTVLVDFANDSVATALEVADALGRRPVGRAAGHLRQARRPRRCSARTATTRRRASRRARRARRATSSTRTASATSRSSSRAASPPSGSARSRTPACRSTPTASARPAARLQRLHRRRRDGRRAPGREGRARAAARTRASAPSASDQRHEAHALEPRRVAAPALLAGSSTRCWSPVLDRRDEPAAGRELVEQRGRDAPARRRGDVDRVVGRVLGQPARAVADERASRAGAGRRERRAARSESAACSSIE